jgi:hypothetical protein
MADLAEHSKSEKKQNKRSHKQERTKVTPHEMSINNQ